MIQEQSKENYQIHIVHENNLGSLIQHLDGLERLHAFTHFHLWIPLTI